MNNSELTPEQIAEFCLELNWFRGCDDWELDEFLIEINADRKKAVAIINQLTEQNGRLIKGWQESTEIAARQEKLIDELQAKIDAYEKALEVIEKGNYPRHDIETFGDEADRYAKTKRAELEGDSDE